MLGDSVPLQEGTGAPAVLDAQTFLQTLAVTHACSVGVATPRQQHAGTGSEFATDRGAALRQ